MAYPVLHFIIDRNADYDSIIGVISMDGIFVSRGWFESVNDPDTRELALQQLRVQDVVGEPVAPDAWMPNNIDRCEWVPCR